jgi:sugar O-acyltransferase (sialic acid O-acetyltransferase NeuD family)|tara:strand:+ start:215 stop:871 length:657 start_codon:yes stop_codon:yes gene_type:complete
MGEIKKVFIYGGTGQAKVVRPIIEDEGAEICAIFDDTKGLKPPFPDISLYEGFESLIEWSKDKEVDDIGFVIAIGNPHGASRLKLSLRLKSLGFRPFSVISKSAIMHHDCKLGEGVQIMPGSIIMPEVTIGDQVIINTNSSIDHECTISDGCEVAPGATLCGKVNLEKNSWVCAGSTILPNINIGMNSIVGAASLVRRDVPENQIVAGVPAQKIRDNI